MQENEENDLIDVGTLLNCSKEEQKAKKVGADFDDNLLSGTSGTPSAPVRNNGRTKRKKWKPSEDEKLCKGIRG